MSRVSSLNRFVEWDRLLASFDVQLDRSVLPACVPCPRCGDRELRLYRDATWGGTWQACRRCNTAGDMIELAAALWKCDLREAVDRLLRYERLRPADSVTPEAVADYLRLVADRQHAQAFWQDAQHYFANAGSSELRQLQQRLGIALTNRDWYRERAQHLVGAAPKDRIDRFFRHAPTPTVGKTLSGRDWRELLLFPFYDLPGRLCGFMFAGRELSEPGADLVYRQVPGATGHESGLSGFELANPPAVQPLLGDTVFLCDDVCLAAKLQLRWLRESRQLLPIVAYHHERGLHPDTVWDWFVGQRTVCVATQASTSLLRLAQRLDATVSCETFRQYRKHAHLYGRTSLAWLQAASAEARPWVALLQALLRDADAISLDDQLTAMQFTAAEQQAFLSHCDDALQAKIGDVLSRPNRAIHVQYGDRTITERQGGWYLSPGDRLLCDATIRIEQAVQTPTQTYYRGVIRYRDHTLPFTAPARDLDRNLFRWMAAHLRDTAQLGVLVYDPAWGRRSLSIALQFQRPQILTAVTKTGWSKHARQFVFPRVTIARDGTLGTPPVPLPADAPCQQFRAYWPISRQTIQYLGETHPDVGMVWAMLLAILRDVLGPLYHRRPRRILLRGPYAQASGLAIARALGCRVHKATVEDVPQNEHNWPLALSASRRYSETFHTSLEHVRRGLCIAAVPTLVADVLQLQRPWTVITCEQNAAITDDRLRYLGQFLVDYLQSLMTRRLALPDGPTLEHQLQDDLAHWFETIGGNPTAVHQAAARLRWGRPGDAAPLAWALQELCARKRLGFLRQEFDPRNRTAPAVLYAPYEEKPAVWIPQEAAARTLSADTGLAVSVPSITQRLQTNQLLWTEAEYRDERHWVCPETWWNQHRTIS